MLLFIAIVCIVVGSLCAHFVSEGEKKRTLKESREKERQEERERSLRCAEIIKPYAQEIAAAMERHRISKDVILWKNIENLAVICSNGHCLARRDMTYAAGTSVSSSSSTRIERKTVHHTTHSTTAYRQRGHLIPDGYAKAVNCSSQEVAVPITDYHTSSHTDYREGCPVCHSTLFEYDSDQGLQQHLKQCEEHEHKLFYYNGTQHAGLTKKIRLYLAPGASCPFCAVDARYRARIVALGYPP